MEFRIWEIGVLLVGLGFLFVCINLAFVIKTLDNTVRRVEGIVEESSRDIGDIIENVAGITTSANMIIGSLTKIAGLVSGVKIVSELKKNKNSRRD